jgi:hypothetical protein
MCICILALVIQHAKRMRRIILLSVACLTTIFFPHYLITAQFSGKKVTNAKCVVLFSLQSFSEPFRILRRIQRYIITYVRTSSSQTVIKLEFLFRQLFEKLSNIKFHWSPPIWSRNVACGQTDKHGETDSYVSQLCERAYELAQALQTHINLIS